MPKHPYKRDSTVTIDLGPDLIKALDRMREVTGCPKSEYIRRVVRSALETSGYYLLITSQEIKDVQDR